MSARTRRAAVTVGVAAMILVAGRPAFAADSDQRLIEAVRHQDRTAIRQLIDQRIDVNDPQPDGATALHWAAYLNDRETIDLLLRAGANVNAANDLGVTPLYLACSSGDGAIAGDLLAAGADANAIARSGESALMAAARTGNVSAVRQLTARRANVNAVEPVHGQTALMWAAAHGHAEVVRLLIAAGADVRVRSLVRHRRVQVGVRYQDHDARGTVFTDLGGFTALLFAAAEGDVEVARTLLDAGSDPDDRDATGASALVVAAHSGNPEVAAVLLEAGANPDAADAGYTALHAAVLRGSPALVRTLLDYGADPNVELASGTPVKYQSKDFAFNVALVGATPFYLAARYAEVEMMRALAAAGADPNHPLRDGTTPLIAATFSAPVADIGDRRERALTSVEIAAIAPDAEERLSLEAVRAAVQLGAHIGTVTRSGDTALHHAARLGFASVLQQLLDDGAAVNATNASGDTALHDAAARGHADAIRVLASRGADLHAKNRRQQTPLMLTLGPVGGATSATETELKNAGDLLRNLGGGQP